MIFKPDESENAGFAFSMDGKHFNNEAFRKLRCCHNVISLPDFYSNINPIVAGDSCVFKFLQRTLGDAF